MGDEAAKVVGECLEPQFFQFHDSTFPILLAFFFLFFLLSTTILNFFGILEFVLVVNQLLLSFFLIL